ncbi:MAG: DUF4070 domain-containing protein, partial [Oligoflexales bacterium]|nr:DUF4070 domain-containing protein [Oligoflexales bacterium]
GTILTKKLIEENRILTYDWTKYTGYYSCIIPKKMTPEQLVQGSDYSTKMVYSKEAIVGRIDRLYKEGPMRGQKTYYMARFFYTAYLLKSLFSWPKEVRNFILSIIKIMWTKRKSKLSILLLFVDHFEYAYRTCRNTEPLKIDV